jgi:hypothetical protein|tara:strand:+ start:114 stop:1391 length:1278 start_codon:yes stop_codon:yes gene_type:complete
MSKIIFELTKVISIFFVILGIKLKAYNLCGLIIWLNIRTFRNISSNTKNTKKVLFFPKSGGNEDLVEAFKGKKNNNIIFFWIPRSFLKKIYSYCFKDNRNNDYFTKIKNPEQIRKKNLYVKSLTKIFYSLDKFLKLDGFISFNIFYYAEKYLDEVCINLNKKFIILHKESTFTPLEEINATKLYQKYNDKSFANKISVYSKSQRNILLKSKIANKKQIVVNGCPRSDYSFKLRKIKPKNNTIVFYLIEKSRGQKFFSKKSKLNWNDLYNKTLKFLIEYAKNNPDIKLILKGKTGIHNNLLKAKFLTKNCTFINGGTGEKFLTNAKVVIAFNSTIVFEAIAGNRNLIIPNFNQENIKNKNSLYKIENTDYFANSKTHFFKKINFYLNLKYENRKLINKEKKILEYYLGNIDGKSGKRLEFFLRKTI